MEIKTPQPNVTVNTEWLESEEQRLSTEGELPVSRAVVEPPNTMDTSMPSEAALELIRRWDWRGEQAKALLEFIKSKWWMGEYLFEATERRNDPIHPWVIRVRMTTGGHSGNTALVSAIQDNLLFWNTFWLASRREGYYELEVFPLGGV